MTDTPRKKISKLAIVSGVFIVLGYLAIPICREVSMQVSRMGFDPTRFQTYMFSIILWFIALLLVFIALILIRCKPQKEKSKLLPSVCLVISSLSIIAFSVPLPEYENTVVFDRDKTFDGDSTKLTQTVIVPTLESPIPEGKNVIWCSSFQLTWNELKNDIIKEPIKLEKNQELADLLNQADQSKQDISEDNYYARAGFVKNNIIETIQSEMAQRFPDEATPSFDDISANTAIISYSFLSANVRFKLPYFENDKELLFTDSNGSQTAITSFGLRERDDYAYYKLRRQLYVLFANHGSDYNLAECAIDLCKDSAPNQIVAAMVEPKDTLLETLSYIDEQSQKTPNEKYYHEFGPNDVLLVPNLFWKIVHSYEKLVGDTLQNTGYKEVSIEKAIQVIQFRLDRSGAELKSESKLYCAPIPTFYTFDRPFLIYMKKRGAEYPFFVMWVDNAELLEKYK